MTIESPPRNHLLMNVREVAQELGITVRTVTAMVKTGRMPAPVRIGRSVRWRRYEIERWIADGCPPVASQDGQGGAA